MSPVLDRLAAIRLMPVVIIDRAEDARPLAAALKAGGLPAAEVTFRTAAAEAAIKAIAEDGDICLGAGTILILLPFGVWLGRLLAARAFRGKLIVEALVTVPLVLPPTVLGFYLLVAFGARSPVGRTLSISGSGWEIGRGT